MLKLILLLGIAAPGPIGQLIYATGLPVTQQANASLPEQKTIDAGYYANQYLGRIYGLFNLPSSSAQRQTNIPSPQPIVYTGYSAPLKYTGLPDILDYISYVAKPWTHSNGQNTQGYGYAPSIIYHDDDDDDDDDDNRGGWGGLGSWGAWGGGSGGHGSGGHGSGGHGSGGHGNDNWHDHDHDHDNHHNDGKPGSTVVNNPINRRPIVVNQIYSEVA